MVMSIIQLSELRRKCFLRIPKGFLYSFFLFNQKGLMCWSDGNTFASFLLIRETLRQKVTLLSFGLSPSSLSSPLSPVVLTGPWKYKQGEEIKLLCAYVTPTKKSKTEWERKQCFILQHLVQSAPWGWMPTGGRVPVVTESGGCKAALFFYGIKNACGWSALWITHRAVSYRSIQPLNTCLLSVADYWLTGVIITKYPVSKMNAVILFNRTEETHNSGFYGCVHVKLLGNNLCKSGTGYLVILHCESFIWVSNVYQSDTVTVNSKKENVIVV